MPARINRQWLLASRPRGALAETDFSYHEARPPTIGDGQFLVRTLYVSVDAGIPPPSIGSVVRGPALGQVVESRHHAFAVGDFVSGLLGWQEYCASDGSGRVPVFRIKPVHPLPRYLGVLGDDGMTAYFGMLQVARPRAGETVLVAGAAGATGSSAAQIAKIRDCRVIGMAGGTEKCRWLTGVLGLDGAIDRESEDFDDRLTALCPDGVNVYFDNVGGRTLDVVLGHMATWGRIALCGTVSGYEDGRQPAAPANPAHLVTRRIRMEGFLASDYAPRFKEAQRQLSAWLATGALRSCERVHEGFENIPRAFLGRFGGADTGKAMVKLADAPIKPFGRRWLGVRSA